jgi:hypothetical protein
MNTSKAAESRGIVSYDTALPQHWVDEVQRLYGLDVRGHFVWSYDKPGLFGFPAPVTERGDDIEQYLVRKEYQDFRYSLLGER